MRGIPSSKNCFRQNSRFDAILLLFTFEVNNNSGRIVNRLKESLLRISKHNISSTNHVFTNEKLTLHKMRKPLLLTFVGLSTLLMISCDQIDQSQSTEADSGTAAKIETVMTKQMQDGLTPDAVLQDLMEGNQRYVSGEMQNRDLPAQVAATTDGQFPKAVILACIDSRVPVEYIFDQGVGDIFVARVAGNIEDEELLGSMEYGVGVAGSKLIMVLGHENCGAVKSAIDKVDVGSENVDALLSHLEQAIQEIDGDRDAKNKAYFNDVIKNNVDQTVEDIRNKSDIIRTLEEEGKVKVVGAYYSLTDGKVTILEEGSHDDHEH
jgi:carbonic anhydrase